MEAKGVRAVFGKALFGWVADPALEGVEAYERSVKEHPNPPAPNITAFGKGG